MNHMSENINEIMGALSKAQGKIQPAAKDKANPYFKSKYADLCSIWEACRESLSENGLAVVQTVSQKPEGLFLLTTLGHSSGQWIRSEMPVILAKQDPQTLGSALTYYRRYSLAAIVGVAPNDDDDGEKAQSGYRQNRVETNASPAPVVVKKISSDQASDLKTILDQCDNEYRVWVYEVLRRNHGSTELTSLTVDIFDRVKSAAIKNMEEKKQKQLVTQDVQ